MEISRKTGLAIGAGILSVGIFGAAGYAYFESTPNAGSAPPAAVIPQSVTSDTPATLSAPPTAPVAADPLHVC